ncbi:MAG: DMT family transporter [Anaerovoracaceae bacterium]|jgi:drug/metabolite transporter (DMT)-like permease
MEKKDRRDVLLGCLCALGCETLFGLSYIFTKQATSHVSALALLGWRFLIAILVMSLCAITGIIKVNLKGKKLKPLLMVALFSPSIYFIGETVGISYTTASESGSFLASIPVVSLLASTLILREKPAKKQVAGILVTLAGVFVTVFAVGVATSFSVLGYVMLTVAVISYALYSVFVEKASYYTGAEVTYVMLISGAIIFGILAVMEAIVGGTVNTLIKLPFADKGFLVAILYQGIGCSVLAFFMSNVAIAKIGVNRTSSFIGVATVVSIIAGILVLKEHFSIVQMVGAIMIIAGVYIANTKL